MSLKIDMMVEHLKATNKDWKLMPKRFVMLYLKSEFKCSTYMAQKAVEKLQKDEKS